jgi:TolB-like protein/DNA-binding winged helix-turn-helix (wHTH) protein/Flp pilus assembly protein TadD
MDAFATGDIFLFESFRLDRCAGGLFRRNECGDTIPVAIGSRALDILGVFVERAGDLVSKDELIAAVWPGTVVEDSNLTVQISALRRVIDNGRSEGSYIQTVAGRGYRFTVAVTRVEANARSGAAASSRNTSSSDGSLYAQLRRASGAAPMDPSVPWRLPRDAFLAMIVLAVIGLVVAANYRWFESASMPPRLSMVVLPFANLGNDPNQEYFVDAITDDLTTDLSRISGSFVIARSTAFTYKGKAIDVKQIGRELGVRYVLEGSVRPAGDQVRVNVQLVDTGSGAHLWADRFETDRANLAAAQTEITGRLAQTLHVELIEAAGRRIEQEKAVDPDARDLVTRGLALYYRPSSAATREEAQRAFERALEIDPRSVDARIGIAVILTTRLGTGSSSSAQHDEARAERFLVEALERDANHAMAHEIMGMLRRIQNRLAESRIEFETAITLDRNDAHAWLGLGQTSMFLGQPEAGISNIETAMRLDPLNPNAAFAHWSLGTCHLLLGHVNEASNLLRKARAENPRVYFFHLYLAAALGLGEDLDEAKAALADAIRLKPEVNSLARWRDHQPWIDNPQQWALREKTVNVGLRRAGMPVE